MSERLATDEHGSFKREDFRRIWDNASEEGREWVRHKCGWEHMSLSAVLADWGMPTREEAIGHGIEPCSENGR